MVGAFLVMLEVGLVEGAAADSGGLASVDVEDSDGVVEAVELAVSGDLLLD